VNLTRLFAAVVCIALMAVRTGGAHLHYCFDGQEPPVSVHVGDAGVHGEAFDVIAAHEDEDVDLSGNGLAKLPKFDLPLLAVVFSCLLGLLGARRNELGPGYTPRFLPPSASFFRPPLRGPPAFLPNLS
jgi:hypothetical protein